MKFIMREMHSLAHNPNELLNLCKGEQVVALTNDNDARLIVLDIDYFNKLLETANSVEIYQELWRAEDTRR